MTWDGKYTRPLDTFRATPLEWMEWLIEQRDDPAQAEYRQRLADARNKLTKDISPN